MRYFLLPEAIKNGPCQATFRRVTLLYQRNQFVVTVDSFECDRSSSILPKLSINPLEQ